MLLLAAKVAVDLPVTRVRYLLFVMPGVALLVALGLRHLARLSPAVAIFLVVALALIGLPQQIDIRQVDGHHTDQALDPLLRSARALDMPVVTANPQAVRLVNAATYPEALLTKGARHPRPAMWRSSNASISPTASMRTLPTTSPADGDRRLLPAAAVLRPGRRSTRLPARPSDAADLAARLGQATGGRVPCRAG